MAERKVFEYQPEHGGYPECVQTWYSMEGVHIVDNCDETVSIDFEDIPKLITALQSAYTYIQQQKENQ